MTGSLCEALAKLRFTCNVGISEVSNMANGTKTQGRKLSVRTRKTSPTGTCPSDGGPADECVPLWEPERRTILVFGLF